MPALPPSGFKGRVLAVVSFSAALLLLLSMAMGSAFVRSVTLTDGEMSVTVRTTERTVGGMLERFPFGILEEDLVYPSEDTRLKNGMRVEITRSMRVNIVDNGMGYEVRVPSGTVRDALERYGKELDPDDIVEPSAESLLVQGMTVRITRVWIDRYIAEQDIPYTIRYEADDSLLRGVEKTTRDGVDGMTHREIEIVYHNGEEAERRVVSEEVAARPVDAVVRYGTKAPPPPPGAPQTTVSPPSGGSSSPPKNSAPSRPPKEPQRTEGKASGGSITVGGKKYSYTAVYSGKATAYTATGSNTASGKAPKRGMVAVDPSKIPLGTRLYVPGYGIAVAEDTGVYGMTVDLFMDTEDECVQWGIRNVQIYILK